MANRIRFRVGDVIIAEGASSFEAYVLDAGSVEVYLKGPPEQRLRTLGPGETFGEMGLLSEQPRSASVRALGDVEVTVIDRDELLSTWRNDPDLLLPILRVLCERVRSFTGLVGELSRRSPEIRDIVQAYLSGGDVPVVASSPKGTVRAFLEGISTDARDSLGGRRLAIERFPFRIGRSAEIRDPLTYNDLAVPDRQPYRVSRNHCMIVHVRDRWFLIDRGSQLGTVVNGTLVGGGKHTGRVQLSDGPNELALGGAGSPYRFRLTVGARE